MISLNDAFYTLKNELQQLYAVNEAAAIVHELLEHVTGLSKFERLMQKEQPLTTGQEQRFNQAKQRLLKGEPLQYVIGVQWFMGRAFEVNQHVLIPRPETEELVQWIVNDHEHRDTLSIFDIGTGSGCIPIMLKLLLPQAKVLSGDISDETLQVAERNALKHDAEIELAEIDFLEERTWPRLDQYDVIVSNPPYIPLSEKDNLDKNVRDYEPGLALFVPDNDPLLFYRKIALFADTHLQPGGAVYCEVHKAHAKETEALFKDHFREVELRKDLQDNERMIRCM